MKTFKSLVTFGFVQAMEGETNHINTVTDEKISMVIKDRDLRWQMYCEPVKITIEKITKEELKLASKKSQENGNKLVVVYQKED